MGLSPLARLQGVVELQYRRVERGKSLTTPHLVDTDPPREEQVVPKSRTLDTPS